MAEPEQVERIGIGELRQNPSKIVAGLKRGKTYVLTEYKRDLAIITPTAHGTVAGVTSVPPTTIPAKSDRPVDVSVFAHHTLTTANTIDDLLDDLKGMW